MYLTDLTLVALSIVLAFVPVHRSAPGPLARLSGEPVGAATGPEVRPGDQALRAGAAGDAGAGVLAGADADVVNALHAPLAGGAVGVAAALAIDPVALPGQSVAGVPGLALADRAAAGTQDAVLLLRAGEDLARIQAGAASVDVDLAYQALRKERNYLVITDYEKMKNKNNSSQQVVEVEKIIT